MRHTVIFCFIILSSFFSSCLLIQESRNNKKLADIEYEYVYQPEEDSFNFEPIRTEEFPDPETSTIAKIAYHPDEIWYHANPWWRIKTQPFPEGSSPIQYRRYAPQYGFSKYVDPVTNSLEINRWQDWLTQNQWNNYEGPIVHAWQGFISSYQNIFKQHPEYLAEKDGIRPGYGKINKLCVSNKNVQSLFTEYTVSRIKANPHYKFISVEPSDGAGFCTCKECSKLGSISNQVFYLANIVGKAIKKDYPQKQIGLYAYYLHSEVPDFKLEDNIKVIVIPQGFQTIYTPLGMMEAWKKHHQNLGLYDYFGIPQWTGDQPRINVEYFASNITFANKNDIDLLTYEAGTSINAIIISTLLSKMAMNPGLKWNDVYEKFLSDCFKDSRVAIKRLFDRWHTYGIMDVNEINFSLYDLNEAAALAGNKDEIQRIRDLKAYLLYIIAYKEWSVNRDERALVEKYFDYVYRSSNRNIVNIKALITQYTKHFNKIPELNEKYKYINAQHKPWIKYLSDKEIDQLFDSNLKKYPPVKVDYFTLKEMSNVIREKYAKACIDTINLTIANRNYIHIYSDITKITLTPAFNSQQKSLVSIAGVDNDFYTEKFLANNERWDILLPEKGIYRISQNRIGTLRTGIKGVFVPLLAQTSKTLENNYSIYTIDQKREFQPAKGDVPVTGSAPYYIIGKKEKP